MQINKIAAVSDVYHLGVYLSQTTVICVDSGIRRVKFVISRCISQFIYCSLADTFEDDNCFTSGKDDLDFAR